MRAATSSPHSPSAICAEGQVRLNERTFVNGLQPSCLWPEAACRAESDPTGRIGNVC
jgi:hypothetical protein